MHDDARRRDAAATRDAILAAARRAFTADSFEAAGVREIAADAGVTAALVNRYFGSKEELFAEALAGGFTLAPVLDGDRAEFGRRVAAHLLTKDYSGQDLDPTIAMLRSISSPTVGEMLRTRMKAAMVEELAEWLGGPKAELRAALIISQISGVDFLRRVVGVAAFDGENAAEAERRLAAALQSYVDAV